MATTITSNNPTIQTERSYKDLDLNFTAHPVKKDVSRHFNEKAVINSVKNLVSTNFYEERRLRDVINNYEPRVSVESVVAIPAPDENGYKVIMTFFIVNLPNPITINFFLERIR